MLPENAKTIWPIVEDVLRSPHIAAWRQALIDNLYNVGGCRVLSLDETMKIAMGLRRYETMIHRREDGGADTVVDDNTCVLTMRSRHLRAGSDNPGSKTDGRAVVGG